MADSKIKLIEQFCHDNDFNKPKINVLDTGDEFVAELVVKTGGVIIAKSAIGSSELEARLKVCNIFIAEIMEKPKEQWMASIQTQNENMSPNNRLENESKVGSGDGIQICSADAINDQVSFIPNCVGMLQEMCMKKGLVQPTYVESEPKGEPHNPVFTMECTITSNGMPITGIGIGCPKKDAKNRSAQEVVRRLNEMEMKPLSVRPGANTSNVRPGANTFDISNYFENKFQDIKQFEQIINENNANYPVILEKMALLLECRLDYVVSTESTDRVTLQVVVKESEYPLITTFGESNDSLSINRRIAAKKAVLMIKILYTKEEN